MEALNQKLANEVIRHAIDVQRFEAYVARNSLAELIRLDRILVGLIASKGPDARLSNLLAVARSEINEAVERAKMVQLRDEERLIQLEATTAAAQINVVTGAPLATAPSSQAFIDVTRKKALVMGAPAKKWWSRQAVATFNAYSDIVTAGFVLGRDTGTMTTDWKLRSGQLRRHAETQVRTGVQSMANAARQNLYERNANVVKGIQALAVFDTRTSALCRGRSGMTWNLDGTPIDANIPYPGPPPWHWNCRSTVTAILKTFGELSEGDSRKLPPATRASMNGQVAEDMTYDEFFKTLSEREQLEILGPAKLRLYKKNKLSMRDMIDQSGNPLTIDQLENRGKQVLSPTFKRAAKTPEGIGSEFVGLKLTGSNDLDEGWAVARKKMLEAEDQTGVEWATVLDWDGNAVLPFKRGTANQVKFTEGEMMRMRGNVLMHNHPKGGPLSGADLGLAKTTKLDAITAISNNQEYTAWFYEARQEITGKDLSWIHDVGGVHMAEQYSRYLPPSTAKRLAKFASSSVENDEAAGSYFMHISLRALEKREVLTYQYELGGKFAELDSLLGETVTSTLVDEMYKLQTGLL